MTGSFANRILEKLKELAAQSETGRVTAGDLSAGLMIQTSVDRKRMQNSLCDMRRAGKVVRIETGVYAVNNCPGKPEIREVMWRILRMRKRVTVDDLVEMAGASRSYAEKWLRMLAEKGVVRETSNFPLSWQLVVDHIDMPADTRAAERLRKLHKKQKEKLRAMLDEAKGLLEQVRAEFEITN